METDTKTILLVSNSPIFGGGERYIVDIFKPLCNKLTIYFLVRNQKLYKELEANNIILFNHDNIWGQLRQLHKELNRLNPSLIIFNGGNLPYFYSLSCKIPFIYIRHTTFNAYRGAKGLLIRFLSKRLFKIAKTTIHVSAFSMKEQKNGESFLLLNSTSLKTALAKKEAKRPIRLLICSRLEPEKGIREVVNAVQMFSKDKVHLTIAGHGSLTKWVKTIKNDNIEYLGFVNELEQIYPNEDVLILCSDFENCPLSIIEAMSFGLAIITTPVGGVPELVKDGDNGLYINKTIESIKSAIQRFVDNPALISQFGEKSQYRFEQNHLLKNNIKKIHTLIQEVLKDTK